MNHITRELDKCKYKAFGNVKTKVKRDNPNVVENLMKRRMDVIDPKHREKRRVLQEEWVHY